MQLFAVIIGLLGLLAMPGLWKQMRHTTLAAPWCWALASAGAVLFVAVQGADDALLNYTAGITTLLPAAAIYGAKRPQDRGWQWIVAALFLMLFWPAGESYFLERSFDLAAQPLRSWFLVILLAVQWGNWSVTSNLGAVTLLTAAQLTMLWPQLPWGNGGVDSAAWLLGVVLLAVVPWWLAWNLRLAKRTAAASGESSFPSLGELAEWKKFRAAYGVVWALRVTERINEVAKRRNWDWRWSWSGATPCNDDTAEPQESPVTPSAAESERIIWRQLWHNIFRRFLDPALFSTAENSEMDHP